MTFYVEEMDNKSNKPRKKRDQRKKTRKGGMPTYNELADVSNLKLGSKPYQEFNYNSAIANIKVSNFVGGAIKKSYNTYQKGMKSTLQKYKKSKTNAKRKSRGGSRSGVADNALTISVNDTYNYSGLGLPKDYNVGQVMKIGRVPHSQMALYS
jgi:hypothetical protein